MEMQKQFTQCDGYLDGFSSRESTYQGEDISLVPTLLGAGVAEAYRLVTEQLTRLVGIRFPSLPKDQRVQADWELLFRTWFFELTPPIEGARWLSNDRVVFDYDSPYCLDIKNSVSYQELKDDFCKKMQNVPSYLNQGQIQARFSFTGPGSGKPDYYSIVEWYIGSYSGLIEWVRIGPNEYEVSLRMENKSGWRSGTRLPKTWRDKIKKETGLEIANFVNDAPRGMTISSKLGSNISSQLTRLGISIPSFGGDYWQLFLMSDRWAC